MSLRRFLCGNCLFYWLFMVVLARLGEI